MLYFIPPEIKTPDWPKDDALGHIPVKLEDGTETQMPVFLQNVIVTGTSGYGKTSLVKKMVKTILENDKNNDMLVVFFQIKDNDFSDDFFEAGDKIVCHSAEKYPHNAVWRENLVREVRLANNPESEAFRISTCFFSELLEKSGQNLLWASTARTLFSDYLMTIVECYEGCPGNKTVIGRLKDMSVYELVEFLGQRSANNSMLKKVFNYEPGMVGYKPPKRAEDVLFFLNDVLQKFSGEFFSDGTDTIAEFLQGNSCKRLFIQHDLSQKDSMSSVERYILKKIIKDKMSPKISAKPLLIVLDEIDKVGFEFNLQEAVTLGRGCKLHTILSTQSFQNLYTVAPSDNREHSTESLLSGFLSIISFHGGDPQTNARISQMFGEKQEKKLTLSPSPYDKAVVTYQKEPIVSDTEFAKLAIGEAYVKIQEKEPIKVKFIE